MREPLWPEKGLLLALKKREPGRTPTPGAGQVASGHLNGSGKAGRQRLVVAMGQRWWLTRRAGLRRCWPLVRRRPVGIEKCRT